MKYLLFIFLFPVLLLALNNTTVAIGDSVLLNHGVTSPAFQWMRKRPSEGGFTAVNGATDSTYRYYGFDVSRDSGSQVFCLLIDGEDTTKSDTTIISVNAVTPVIAEGGNIWTEPKDMINSFSGMTHFLINNNAGDTLDDTITGFRAVPSSGATSRGNLWWGGYPIAFDGTGDGLLFPGDSLVGKTKLTMGFLIDFGSYTAGQGLLTWGSPGNAFLGVIMLSDTLAVAVGDGGSNLVIWKCKLGQGGALSVRDTLSIAVSIDLENDSIDAAVNGNYALSNFTYSVSGTFPASIQSRSDSIEIGSFNGASRFSDGTRLLHVAICTDTCYFGNQLQSFSLGMEQAIGVLVQGQSNLRAKKNPSPFDQPISRIYVTYGAQNDEDVYTDRLSYLTAQWLFSTFPALGNTMAAEYGNRSFLVCDGTLGGHGLTSPITQEQGYYGWMIDPDSSNGLLQRHLTAARNCMIPFHLLLTDVEQDGVTLYDGSQTVASVTAAYIDLITRYRAQYPNITVAGHFIGSQSSIQGDASHWVMGSLHKVQYDALNYFSNTLEGTNNPPLHQLDQGYVDITSLEADTAGEFTVGDWVACSTGAGGLFTGQIVAIGDTIARVWPAVESSPCSSDSGVGIGDTLFKCTDSSFSTHSTPEVYFVVDTATYTYSFLHRSTQYQQDTLSLTYKAMFDYLQGRRVKPEHPKLTIQNLDYDTLKTCLVSIPAGQGPLSQVAPSGIFGMTDDSTFLESDSVQYSGDTIIFFFSDSVREVFPYAGWNHGMVLKDSLKRIESDTSELATIKGEYEYVLPYFLERDTTDNPPKHKKNGAFWRMWNSLKRTFNRRWIN